MIGIGRLGRSIVLMLLLIGVGGCHHVRQGTSANMPALPCRDGESVMQRSTLYFGTAIPDSTDTVDQHEWLAFLADSVTPRFPDGLTWFDASGQWRGADGRIVSEHSRVLVLMHADSTATRTAIDEVRTFYRTRFKQESTLRERSVVCVSF